MTSGGSRKIEMTWRCSSCGEQNLGRHKTCVKCGDPKDASEKFEMPSDTARAPTVTDPELLRHAHAGPDWRCAYCGSDQRRLDGECANCGGARGQGASVRAAAAAVPLAARDARSVGGLSQIPGPAAFLTVLVGLVGTCGGAVGVGSLTNDLPPTVDLPATVADASWERVVTVERWQILDGEGFAESRPAEAFDVSSQGQRHHHDEQVFDHMETETYYETVPDGFDTETYTEQVSCGQDCTTTPETCTEHCTSDDNGFATCSQSCSGGGQSCTTRYCSETRSRQVPRTRQEARTRQVPRYRAEPRTAEWFTWRVWGWRQDRVLRAAGTGSDPRWPPAEEVRLGEGLTEGQREREVRRESFVVHLAGGPNRELRPATEADFRRFAPGSVHTVRVDSRTRMAIAVR